MTPHQYGLCFWVFGKGHHKIPKMELGHFWRVYYNGKEIYTVRFINDHYARVSNDISTKHLMTDSSEEVLQKIDEYIRSSLNK